MKHLFQIIGSSLGRFSYPVTLFLLCFAGLSLRLVFIFTPGYVYDVQIFRTWGQEVNKYGIVRSYSSLPTYIEQPNYPPIMMWIWGASVKTEAWFSDQKITLPPNLLMKIPAILADLALSIVIFLIISVLVNRPTALIASLLLLCNPAFFIDSSIWIQNDSIYMLFFVTGLLLFMRNKYLISGIVLMASILTKPQSVIFVPVGIYLIIVMVLTKRMLISDLFKLILGLFTSALLILHPFIIQNKVNIIWNLYSHSIGYYSKLSMNAFNFWWMAYADKSREIVSKSPFLFGISYRNFGLLAFFSYFAKQ